MVAVLPTGAAKPPEAVLWDAVIWQVLVDLASADKADRQSAESYVGTRPTRDFAMVCDLADLDPRRTHTFLLRVIGYDWKARRAFGFGDRGRAACVSPRAVPEAPAGLVSTTELATLLRVSPARVGQLVAEGRFSGCFQEHGRHRYFDAEACAAAYCRKRRS